MSWNIEITLKYVKVEGGREAEAPKAADAKRTCL